MTTTNTGNQPTRLSPDPGSPTIGSRSEERSGRRAVLLGIPGSLRRDSFNRGLLRAAEELAADDLDVRIYDGLAEVPPFSEDAEESPASAVTDLRRRIEEADMVLVATPEYNSSIPGTLKNALDWASRPYGAGSLAEKPMAVIGASPGHGGAEQAQDDLRRVLRRSGAEVLDQSLAVSEAHRRFDETGRLIDEDVRTALGEIVARLTSAAAG